MPTRVCLSNTHHTNIMNKKDLGQGREHKEVTCAVRLNQTMYNQLCDVAKGENSSLSDVIRGALVKRIEDYVEKDMEKQLKAARLEAELRKLREA